MFNNAQTPVRSMDEVHGVMHIEETLQESRSQIVISADQKLT